MKRMSASSCAVSGSGRRALGVMAVIGLLLTGSPLAAVAAPAATASAVTGSTGVFAIDNDHHTLVFIPTAGGAPRPVTTGLTNPTKIVPSRKGSIFIVDGTRLLKVNPHRVVTTIRADIAPRADIAVDDNNWLFVLDGSSLVKYSPLDGSSPVVVASGLHYEEPSLTIDAVGNASITAANPAEYTETLITTFPVRGGIPIVRKLVAADDAGQTYFRRPLEVVEARDGTIFMETAVSGGSGAIDLDRVKPGPAGLAKVDGVAPEFSEYAFDVDSSSRFYLLQNRHWCSDPVLGDGSCTADYGVDVVQRYAASGGGRVDIPLQGVDLPVGGISVASSGAIYVAVLVSPNTNPATSTIVPRMLRISPAGGASVVLAKGHFYMPVAENFLWYAS